MNHYFTCMMLLRKVYGKNIQLILQKIDYVLVYSEAETGKENEEEEKQKAEARGKFEENLRKQGLIVEHVNSTDEQVR